VGSFNCRWPKIDSLVNERVVPSRSSIIEEAIQDKLVYFDHELLVQECEKLNKTEEQEFSEQGMNFVSEEWLEY
jgi:predicted rRNA methylase YqxC with S4 and FtsJ domains